jgi:hypothetical protein
MLARADTNVRGRFCVKRCGPSRRRVRNASAVLKKLVRQPEKTFSTVCDKSGHSLKASFDHLGHQAADCGRMSRANRETLKRINRGASFHPQFDSIFWSIASTECGEIPSSTNPGISGDDTVSICISST